MAEQKFQRILLRRGALADLPSLSEGEPGFATDSEELFVGTANGNRRVLAPVYNLMYTPFDYTDKSASLKYWERVSGTGTMSYESSDSVIGAGCWSVTGTGVWAVNFSIPCNPTLGMGGLAYVKQASGAATISIGFRAYDSSGSEIAFNASAQNFLANAVAASASWTQYRSHELGEGAGASQLPSGTRFVRARFEVSANTGTTRLDHLLLMPLGFSAYSLYG